MKVGEIGDETDQTWVRQALTQLWHVANGICSKRLVPFLPELIKSMERHGHLALPEKVRSKLLTISPATMGPPAETGAGKVAQVALGDSSGKSVEKANPGSDVCGLG